MGSKRHNPERKVFKGRSYKKDGTKKGGKTIKQMFEDLSDIKNYNDLGGYYFPESG